MSNNLRLPGEPKRLARVGSSDLLGHGLKSSNKCRIRISPRCRTWLSASEEAKAVSLELSEMSRHLNLSDCNQRSATLQRSKWPNG
jgi:hypothetical protein